MGVWSTLLKYSGKAAKVSVRQRRLPAKYGESGAAPFADLAWRGSGRQDGDHRRRGRLCGLGEADHRQSVVRIVSDAVVGESVTDTIACTADGVRELTGKAGEAVSSVSGAVTGIDNKLNGVSNFCDKPPVAEVLICSATFPQPWQRQRLRIEYCRTGCGGVPHIRTLRLAGQDCRRISRHDAHRQQCWCLPHAGDRKRATHPYT